MPHSFHIRIDILYSYRKLRGNAVHCLASYFVYEKCEHAVCNAHLLRDLKAFYEQTNQTYTGYGDSPFGQK